LVHATDSSLTRFAESRIHQNVAETNALLSVRAIIGKRIGCARGNQLSLEGVQSVARRALDLARVAAEDERFVSLPGPQPLPTVDSYAEASAASTPEQRAEIARSVAGIAGKSGCRASGSLSTEVSELMVGNSLGVRAYAPATQASLVVVVDDGESSGYADWRGVDTAGLDAGLIAETATEKCVRGRGAEGVEPGEYPVILEPPAVGDMLTLLAYMGLGALALQEGRSFLAGRIGEKVMGESISIWDDATDGRQLAFPFDFEGVPKRKVMLIEKGVARTVVYDSYTANREGKHSTGHALPAPNTHGPMPLHLFLGTGEASLDEMIGSTERGILVTRFHYTNVVHEKETIITGMTRDGTFLVENGEVARPLKNLRFTQSILEALNRVEMVGKEARLSEYAYVPALKIARLTFTS
jgi:predicted Zn-dependent protease